MVDFAPSLRDGFGERLYPSDPGTPVDDFLDELDLLTAAIPASVSADPPNPPADRLAYSPPVGDERGFEQVMVAPSPSGSTEPAKRVGWMLMMALSGAALMSLLALAVR